MSHEDFRKGYEAGYMYGYNDGVTGADADYRTPTQRFDENGRECPVADGQIALEIRDGALVVGEDA